MRPMNEYKKDINMLWIFLLHLNMDYEPGEHVNPQKIDVTEYNL